MTTRKETKIEITIPRGASRQKLDRMKLAILDMIYELGGEVSWE